MLKRVLVVSSSAAGAVSAATNPLMFPAAAAQSGTASADANRTAVFEQFALFADNVEARAIHVKRYHATDGYEADPTLEVEPSPRSTQASLRAAIQEGLQEIPSNPVTAEELQAAVTVLITPSEANKQILDASQSVIPQHQYGNMLEVLNMNPATLQNMATVAHGMLANDEELAIAVSRSLLRIAGQEASTKRTSPSPSAAPAPMTANAPQSDPAQDAWDELRKMYKCTICQDVMCVPHLVIECVHSFCGACIQQHIEINAEDCDMICCPKCRQEIEQQPCYEPDFDNRIVSDVLTAPDSDSKQYWLERRDEFLPRLQLDRRNRRAKKDAEDSDNNGIALSPWLHSVLGIVAVMLVLVVVMRKQVANKSPFFR